MIKQENIKPAINRFELYDINTDEIVYLIEIHPDRQSLYCKKSAMTPELYKQHEALKEQHG